ncbi:unnamed protein product [Agarophyton chilense]
MRKQRTALFLSRAPADYKPIPRNVIQLFIALVPCTISVLILKVVPFNILQTSSNTDANTFRISTNGTSVFQDVIEWTPALIKTSAIEILPKPFGALVACDHPTNECFMLPTNAPVPLPFLLNAGGAHSDSHAASLLRPAISAMKFHSCDLPECTVMVGRHAARDVAILTLQAHEHTLYPTYTVKSLATKWNNTRLNAPNSLAFDAQENLFFSDAYFGLVESVDVFDRKLDEPPGADLPQAVYYISASDVRSVLNGQLNNADPILLINNLDRPSGLAMTTDNRLLVAQASPRKPCLTEYVIVPQVRDGQEILVAKDPVVLYDWTASLHNWEQTFFSGVLGNIVLDEKNRLYVGVADGVAVFDVSQRCTGQVLPVAWMKAPVRPGPARVSYERGELYIATSSKIAVAKVS